MKILIISIVDIKKVPQNRIHHFVKYLSQKHDVTVLCLNDHWNAQKVDTESYYKDFQEIITKIEIRYFTKKNINPILQELFFPFLITGLENEKFDIILNYNTLVSGSYIAKKLGIPMVYDLADDLPSMIAENPHISSIFRGAGKWFGEKMVKHSILHSVAVCAPSDAYQEKYSVPDEKFHLISNGVDTSLFRKVESSIRKDLNLESDFTLGYVGVLREWVDFTHIYQVLKKLDATKLIIVGQEGLFRENQELVKKLGIKDKVIFTGNVPYSRVPDYISAMDVCIIPFKNNDISHNAVPLKLFEYMACEKPVISSNLQGVKNIVGDRILYANSTDEYLSKITLLQKGRISENLNESLREFVLQKYTWEKNGEYLNKVLEKISHAL